MIQKGFFRFEESRRYQMKKALRGRPRIRFAPFLSMAVLEMEDTKKIRQETDPARIAVVILAAGLGKRMKSDKAKVLHEILGVPMVMYVVQAARALAGNNVICVVGNQADAVEKTVSRQAQLLFALQKRQLGTGHAVLSAMPHLPANVEEVVILSGDVPLLSVETLKALVKDHVDFQRDLTLLGARLENPTGYGRILYDAHRRVTAVVEEADASEAQRRINVVNAGTYCARRSFLSEALQQIRPENAQGEFYLTDIIGIGYRTKRKVGVVIGENPAELMGVNTPEDRDRVEAIMRRGRWKSVDFMEKKHL